MSKKLVCYQTSHLLTVSGWLLLLILGTPTLALAAIHSSKSACSRIKVLVAKQQSAPHGSREYRCDFHERVSKGRYYVFALRSKYPPPDSEPDWVGSTLVGWFAVSKKTGEVYYWDVGEEAIKDKF